MFVSDENSWLFFVANIGIILFLYVMKSVSLRCASFVDVLMTFAMALAVCIPMTWAFYYGWNDPFKKGIGIYVWIPFASLTVPMVSFCIDLYRRAEKRPNEWRQRLPLELLIAVPVWYCFWVFMSFMLGYVFI